jgi:hypothetical protein
LTEVDFAYQYYLKSYYSNYDLPADIISYYKDKAKHQIPATALPRMNTGEDYRYCYAARRLHQYLLKKFKKVSIRINHEIIKKEVRLIDWNTPVRMSIIPND